MTTLLLTDKPITARDLMNRELGIKPKKHKPSLMIRENRNRPFLMNRELGNKPQKKNPEFTNK